MKIVGLITEYNPFHNGHLYHIRKAKELTQADAVIAVMSGNYVQRGAPALFPKMLRTECALRSGVDVVIELPICYATGSAEYFALGAVTLLEKLGCVDALCFGSECGDLKLLYQIADILEEEPLEFQIALQRELKKGSSFPAARQRAFFDYIAGYPAHHGFDDISPAALERVFSDPNNILGIEYLKALKRLRSTITPYTIKREGASYHEDTIQSTLSSASAIRRHIEESKPLSQMISSIPFETQKLLDEAIRARSFVTKNEFSLMIKTILLYEPIEHLIKYSDVSVELTNRIKKHLNDYISFEQFCDLIKTKELTYTRISRALLHILLRIEKEELSSYLNNEIIYYARILGFRKDSSSVLTEMKKHASIPLVTKPSRTEDLIPTAKQMLAKDILASNLYYSVLTDRQKAIYPNESTHPLVIV